MKRNGMSRRTSYCVNCGKEGKKPCCTHLKKWMPDTFDEWFDNVCRIAREMFDEDASFMRFEFHSLYEQEVPAFPAVCEMFLEADY